MRPATWGVACEVPETLLVAYSACERLHIGTTDTQADTHAGAANPGRDDVLARREDLDDGTVVGEGRAGIGDGSGTDGDDTSSTSGGSRAGIGVAVTSGDGDMNAFLGEL